MEAYSSHVVVRSQVTFCSPRRKSGDPKWRLPFRRLCKPGKGWSSCCGFLEVANLLKVTADHDTGLFLMVSVTQRFLDEYCLPREWLDPLR